MSNIKTLKIFSPSIYMINLIKKKKWFKNTILSKKLVSLILKLVKSISINCFMYNKLLIQK